MCANNSLSGSGSDNALSPDSLVGPFKFSFYRRPVKNTVPTREMTLLEVYHDIKSERNQGQTKALRAMANKEQAKAFKAQSFDYVTFSGTFSKRNDASLVRHSGLLTIDLDHVVDLLSLKTTLLVDPFFDTELLFVSPSGDGLKWIVSIDPQSHSHQHWFKAIAHYLKITYQVEVDASGKDLSRACFLPYDPEVYIHTKYIKS